MTAFTTGDEAIAAYVAQLLEDAAAILAGTTDVACGEIFFVAPEPPRRRARRRRPG